MSASPVYYSPRPRPSLHRGPLRIGCLIYDRLDQIDFTGPFEVFSHLPETSVEVIAPSLDPVTDVNGLVLTPTMTIGASAGFDVLSVAGGLGQQALMEDEPILSLIRQHAAPGKIIFSVCTGALLCGASGVLQGRQATTHWAARPLLPLYGAEAIEARVVVDGNLVSCAGVTAGLDGALLLSLLLRGKAAAEQIQLAIEYDPDPLLHSGSPQKASPETVRAFFRDYGGSAAVRQAAAERFAASRRGSLEPPDAPLPLR